MLQRKSLRPFRQPRYEIIETIEVDLAPASLVLSHCQRLLYVICYVDGLPGTGTLNVIETKTNTIIAKVQGLFGPFGIALSKCGSLAYVTNFGSNNFVIDAYVYNNVEGKNQIEQKPKKKKDKAGGNK